MGNFGFNNNMTSNCAGTAAGCTVNSSTGFDVASFLLGYATTKTRNLFDAGTYTEKRAYVRRAIERYERLEGRRPPRAAGETPA